MKKAVVALAAAAALFPASSSAATAPSFLKKSRKHVEASSPRKLALFVRTGAVANANGTQPIFGQTGGGPDQASNLVGTGGVQPGLSMSRVQFDGIGTISSGGGDCHPKCWWSCGNADCDEVCDPVCAPPQCETACAPIALSTCRQVCDKPKCAIVCPSSHCEHGGCPGCKTVCAPPTCHTECAEQCESKCSEPQCTWKCNPGQCEKPRCSLQCGGAKVCGLDGNLNARPPPFGDNMVVLSKGLASADPKTLAAFAAKGGGPAPAPAGGGGGGKGAGWQKIR